MVCALPFMLLSRHILTYKPLSSQQNASSELRYFLHGFHAHTHNDKCVSVTCIGIVHHGDIRIKESSL